MQTVQMVAYKKKQADQAGADKAGANGKGFDLLGAQEFPLNSVHFKPMEEYLWYEANRRGLINNGDTYAFRARPLALSSRAEEGGETFSFVGGFMGELYSEGEEKPRLTCRWTTSEVFGQVISMILMKAMMDKKIAAGEKPGCYFIILPDKEEPGVEAPLLWTEKQMPEKRLARGSLSAQGTPDRLFKESGTAAQEGAATEAVPEEATGGEQEQELEGSGQGPDAVTEIDPAQLIFPRVVLKDPGELERSKAVVRQGDNKVNEVAFLLAGEAYLDPEDKIPWVEVDRIIPVAHAPATGYEVRIPGETAAKISYDYASSCHRAPTFPLVGWAHSHVYEYMGAVAARERAAQKAAEASGKEADPKKGEEPKISSGLMLSATDCLTQQIDWPRQHQVALLLSLNGDCEVESAWYGWCCGQVVELQGIYTNLDGA